MNDSRCGGDLSSFTFYRNDFYSCHIMWFECNIRDKCTHQNIQPISRLSSNNQTPCHNTVTIILLIGNNKTLSHSPSVSVFYYYHSLFDNRATNNSKYTPRWHWHNGIIIIIWKAVAAPWEKINTNKNW